MCLWMKIVCLPTKRNARPSLSRLGIPGPGGGEGRLLSRGRGRPGLHLKERGVEGGYLLPLFGGAFLQ